MIRTDLDYFPHYPKQRWSRKKIMDHKQKRAPHRPCSVESGSSSSSRVLSLLPRRSRATSAGSATPTDQRRAAAVHRIPHPYAMQEFSMLPSPTCRLHRATGVEWSSWIASLFISRLCPASSFCFSYSIIEEGITS